MLNATRLIEPKTLTLKYLNGQLTPAGQLLQALLDNPQVRTVSLSSETRSSNPAYVSTLEARIVGKIEPCKVLLSNSISADFPGLNELSGACPSLRLNQLA
jgi:hypothetical protein